MGFYLTNKSQSNYNCTVFSIPSSLRMNFFKKKDLNLDLLKAAFPYFAIENNNVRFFLKRLGYEYINIPSYWEPASIKIKRQHNFNYKIPMFLDLISFHTCTATNSFIAFFALRLASFLKVASISKGNLGLSL